MSDYPDMDENPVKITRKRMRLALQPAQKSPVTRKSRRSRKSKSCPRPTIASDFDSEPTGTGEVDFDKLQVLALRKYRKFYDLQCKGQCKSVMVKYATAHFKTISLESEKDILTYFIHFVKKDNDTFRGRSRSYDSD